MKKHCLMLFFMAASAIAFGQNAIPNGNFETWNTGTYSHPANYPYSSNNENAWIFIENSVPFNLIKSTDPYHGSYAVQLSTQVVGTDTVFGYFINGQPNSDDFNSWSGGLPYSQQPTGIKGYYKYNVATDDSATILLVFSKKGRNLGSYIYNVGGVHTSYTPFNFTLDPPLIERGLANNDVRAIVNDSEGNFWFGTNGGGVSKYSVSGWTTYTTTDGLVNDTIHSIMIDDLGNKWFSTPKGVSKYNDTIWVTYTTTDGLANNDVYGMHKSNNKIWFGTNGSGVSRFDGSNWTTFTKSDGLVNDTVRPIRKDSQGNIWFGTVGGVSMFDGTNWTNYTTNEGLANNDVRHIQIDASNNIWFATNGGGVSIFNGATWSTLTTSDGLASNFVNKILIDPNGTKWFGTLGGGLSKFDGTNWTTYTTANGLASDSIRSVSLTQSNVKFFGTPQGISKLEGTTWTTISKITSTTPDSVIFAAASSNVKNDKEGLPGSTLLLDSVSLVGVDSQPSWLNGDFESWEDVTTNLLDGWYTESQNGDGVYKTTDKVSGDYAVELVTYLGDKDGHPIARAGVIRTGYYPRNCEDDCNEMGGYPYSIQKDTLTFYYKYSPESNDSANVSLSFKKSGTIFQRIGLSLHTASTFQHAELPFDLSQAPDSVIIDIQSSDWQDSLISFIGSRLIIDEIQFKSQPLPNSIIPPINNPERTFSIFPNPASKTININIKGRIERDTEYNIYNTTGSLIKSGKINRNIQEIPVNDLENGIYLFSIKSRSAVASSKLIILH
ncbi:MAG: two-component regulator propeller domain-containing protein [Bacteroidales bacterium]